jgi:chromosome segregation ATPase
MDRIERRMRAVEQAVRSAEDDRWRNTNPEARARAQSAVEQLEVTISDLKEQIDKARTAGKASRVSELEASLEAREQWLEQARQALADFGA